jgi:hypothetical protein
MDGFGLPLRPWCLNTVTGRHRGPPTAGPAVRDNHQTAQPQQPRPNAQARLSTGQGPADRGGDFGNSPRQHPRTVRAGPSPARTNPPPSAPYRWVGTVLTVPAQSVATVMQLGCRRPTWPERVLDLGISRR